MEQDLGKTSTGIQPNVAALLCYLVGFVTGLIFFIIEKDNKFVRFHAMQSIIVFGALFVLQWACALVFYPLASIVGLLTLASWVILMVKAYQGEKFKLPVVGDLAEQQA